MCYTGQPEVVLQDAMYVRAENLQHLGRLFDHDEVSIIRMLAVNVKLF